MIIITMNNCIHIKYDMFIIFNIFEFYIFSSLGLSRCKKKKIHHMSESTDVECDTDVLRN